MQKQYKMTMEHLVSLRAELDYIKAVREREVAEQIKIARGFGDLSENSEYDEAKNEQGRVASRRAELEDIIPNAAITDLVSEHLEELRQELKKLKRDEPKAGHKVEELDKTRRPDDLAAESAYNEAKSEHDKMCARVRALETTIPEFSDKVSAEEQPGERGVNIGARIRITFLDGFKFAGMDEMTFVLVGSQQASMKDLSNIQLSDESPIGKAVMGHHVGDEIKVEGPSGTFSCQVAEIIR